MYFFGRKSGNTFTVAIKKQTGQAGLEFSKARLQVALSHVTGSRFLQHGMCWDLLGLVPDEALWVNLSRDLPEQFQHFSASLDESSCVGTVVNSVQFICALTLATLHRAQEVPKPFSSMRFNVLIELVFP